MADEGAALQQTIKTESIPHHPGAALSVYTGTAHGNIKKENLQQSKAMGTIPGSDEIPLQRKSKSSTQRARDASVRNSNPANLPGLIGGEITYTPTTHRISKAKKGKKVHGCTFPGCTKIFTRAEHRKRHEANHNTHPAFQCQIEGCKKPFQRADLLNRHMERQHNIPVDPSAKSHYSRSTHSASPSLGHVVPPHFARHNTSTTSPLPQTSGAMSIGSIIEHSQYPGEYRSHSIPPGLQEISAQTSIGTAPRSLHPDMLYGLASPADSPLYASSDSCYSPLSDYLQPHQPVGPYYGHEIPRPQTVAAESGFQAMVNSPVTHSPVSVGPLTPAWGPTHDTVTIGFANEAAYAPPHQQLQYSSPQWTSTTTIPQYELALPSQQPWPWTKVSF